MCDFCGDLQRKLYLVYDRDAAGQQAAERSISRFLAQDLDLRVLNVPSGKDPADYLEDHTRQKNFTQLISTGP